MPRLLPVLAVLLAGCMTATAQFAGSAVCAGAHPPALCRVAQHAAATYIGLL